MSSSLSYEVPWGPGAQGNLWLSPGKLSRRVLSEERGELLAAPELWLLPSHSSGRVATPSIVL